MKAKAREELKLLIQNRGTCSDFSCHTCTLTKWCTKHIQPVVDTESIETMNEMTFNEAVKRYTKAFGKESIVEVLL